MEGQQFPESTEVTALSLFQLFFDDKVVERINVITHTLAYAESKKRHCYDLYPLQFIKRRGYDFYGCWEFMGREIIEKLGVQQKLRY